jgi:ribosomal protein S18 acetylase RimI-like enzyme
MIRIAALQALGHEQLVRLVTGYETDARYEVDWSDAARETHFSLRLVSLPAARTVRFDYLDEETVARYQALLAAGTSLGAYDGDELVGLALAEALAWNETLSIWEFHVAPEHRGQGIGSRLMAAVTEMARDHGLRAIVCETQNGNAPAIRFYRRQGFRLEGVDIAYYTNQDWPDGDVAVFMRKQLD